MKIKQKENMSKQSKRKTPTASAIEHEGPVQIPDTITLGRMFKADSKLPKDKRQFYRTNSRCDDFLETYKHILQPNQEQEQVQELQYINWNSPPQKKPSPVEFVLQSEENSLDTGEVSRFPLDQKDDFSNLIFQTNQDVYHFVDTDPIDTSIFDFDMENTEEQGILSIIEDQAPEEQVQEEPVQKKETKDQVQEEQKEQEQIQEEQKEQVQEEQKEQIQEEQKEQIQEEQRTKNSTDTDVTRVTKKTKFTEETDQIATGITYPTLIKRNRLVLPILVKRGEKMDTRMLDYFIAECPEITKKSEEQIDDVFSVFESYFKKPVLAILTDFNNNPTNVLIRFDSDKTARFYVDAPTEEELTKKTDEKFKNIRSALNTDGILLVPCSNCHEFSSVPLQ